MNVFYKRKGLLLFLLPGLSGIVLFYFLPFVAGAFLSFTNAGGRLQFVGLQNYIYIFGSILCSFWAFKTPLYFLFYVPRWHGYSDFF